MGKPYILMLEDDSDDRYITEKFFSERGFEIALEFVLNSRDVIPFLFRCLECGQDLPQLILLDRNAPADGGMEVLKHIKSEPQLQSIPIVMISGSARQEDIAESYRLGVSSFIVKPITNYETAETIETFIRYWFKIVALPSRSIEHILT